MSVRHKWISLLLPISLLLNACSLLPAEEELPRAPVLYQQEEVLYETVTVSRGNLTLEKVFSSEYQAAQEENLCFTQNGQAIGAIYVEMGDQVKAGDLLAELDNTQLLGQIAAQERTIRALQIQISQAEDNLAVLRKQIELLKEAVVLEPQTYTAQLQSAQFQEDNAEDSISYLNSLLRIEKTQLEELNEDLRARQLFAGIDGTIRYVLDLGDSVTYSRNGQNICSIADYSNAAFVGEYSEEIFVQGQYVTLTYNKQDCDAQVTGVHVELIPGKNPEDEPQKVVTVSFVLTTPDATLSVGTRGTVRTAVNSRENVLLLPEECIEFQSDSAYVYYLDAEGVRAVREITVGLIAEGMVEIVSGLQEGEAVLLLDGQIVV